MSTDIDPRIQAELESGEILLWQARPRLMGLLTPSSILVMLAGLIAIPLVYDYLAGVASADGDTDLLIAARAVALVLVAIIFGHTGYTIWSTPRRLYAVTNRRLLEWNGATLKRAETPMEIEKVRIIRRLGTQAGDVIWRTETQWHTEKDSSERKTRRVPIGFKGLGEPDQVAQMLERWHGERFEEARRTSEVFRQAVVEGRVADVERSGAASTIIRPDLGIALSYPVTWRADASKSVKLGPIKAQRELRPLAKAGTDWDTLRLRSAASATLEIGFVSNDKRQTLEGARSDPWSRLLNVRSLSEEPDLQIGPWQGFGITRTTKEVGLLGMPLLRDDLLFRQIWLDDGRRQIVLKMICPAHDQETQLAINAVIGTLRRG